jgi:hypothetical protein
MSTEAAARAYLAAERKHLKAQLTAVSEEERGAAFVDLAEAEVELQLAMVRAAEPAEAGDWFWRFDLDGRLGRHRWGEDGGDATCVGRE